MKSTSTGTWIDAFLRFLDQMDVQAKLDRSERAKIIEHHPMLEAVDVVEIS
jgi:hypothetical protein